MSYIDQYELEVSSIILEQQCWSICLRQSDVCVEYEEVDRHHQIWYFVDRDQVQSVIQIYVSGYVHFSFTSKLSKIFFSDPQPHPQTFFKCMEILVPEIGLYLDVWSGMCKNLCSSREINENSSRILENTFYRTISNIKLSQFPYLLSQK